MKGKYTLMAASLVAAATLFMSYASGPTSSTGDRTGSPASSGLTCTNCHNPGNNSRPALTITVVDAVTNYPVLGYEPGKQYKVKLTCVAPGALAKFGFQACILRAGNAQAGVLTTSMANTKITPRSGVQYAEQSASLNTNAGNNDAEFLWTAPSPSVGNVTVYGIINCVNGNGQDNGDIPSQSASFTLSAPTSVGSVAYQQADLNIYPNPSSGNFTAALTVQQSGSAVVEILDIAGRKISVMQQPVQQGQNKITLDGTALERGIYVVKISGEQFSVSRSIIRQ